MRRIALLLTLSAASAACGGHHSGGGDAGGPPSDGTTAAGAPRLIAPLSMSMVTQQKPKLRWTLDAGSGTPIVEICKDRGCPMSLGATQLAGDNLSAVPAAALPPGWVFWRVRVMSGSQTLSSATWQFWVGK